MDKLYLGMILHMNFRGVLICTIKDMTFFEITKETDVKTFNTDYFNPPTFFSIDLLARTDVYYLNQISGKRPYGQELEQLCFSSEDKCYNASINGPDVLFQDKFFRQTNFFRNQVRVINKCNSIFPKKMNFNPGYSMSLPKGMVVDKTLSLWKLSNKNEFTNPAVSSILMID